MRIGELAEAAGTTTKTLRFYEEQGLLPPAERTPAGYRDYTPDAVSRIDFVHRGQAAGLTLAQIKQILDRPVVDIQTDLSEAEVAAELEARGLARRAPP